MTSKLSQFLKDARQSLGITQEQLSQRLSYKGVMTISDIETGRRLVPPHKVEEFAKALNVDPMELLALLPDDDRYRVIREKVSQAQAFNNPKSNLRPMKMTQKMPLYVVNAGWRPLVYEEPVGYVPIPDELFEKLGGRGIACIVDGDSMEPLVSDGDIVIVDTGMEPEKGTVCICNMCVGADNPDNLATLKTVYFTQDGKIRLVAENNEYDQETIDPRDTVTFNLWPVVYHIRTYKKTRGLKSSR